MADGTPPIKARTRAGLYREQALEFRLRREDGRVRLAFSPGGPWICGLLAALLFGCLVLLSLGDYARKTTVSGIVATDNGIKRVFVPRTGTSVRVLAAEGDRVALGDPLMIFHVPSAVKDQAHARTVAELDGQMAAVRLQIAGLAGETAQEAMKLRHQNASLIAAMARFRRVILLQADQLRQARHTLEAARPLFEAGSLSRLEWGRLNGAVVEMEQALEQLRADQSGRELQVEANALSLTEARARQRARVAALEREQARLRQEAAGIAGRDGFTLRAPVAGFVVRHYLAPGDTASMDQPALSIRPANARLVARLYVPSEAAGFIAPGQPVNLLYDAFPYQQFGTHQGTVTSISAHALMPGEGPVDAKGLPLFEVEVGLARSWVEAYGQRLPLRDGMTLSADIVLERRSLLDWLLAPLRVMRGRSL